MRSRLMRLTAVVSTIIVLSALVNYSTLFTDPGEEEDNIYQDRPRIELNITVVDLQPDTGLATAIVNLTAYVPKGRVRSLESNSAIDAILDNGRIRQVFEFRGAPGSDEQFDVWTSQPARMEIYFWGAQSLFPVDTYSFVDVVELQGRGSWSEIKGDSDSTSPYHVLVQVEMNPANTDWKITDKPRDDEIQIPESTVEGSFVLLTVARPVSFQIYVFSVALLPILIALALIAKSKARSGTTFDQTSPLELASALIAVLALRQVLTPASISSITLLDRLLAAELASILIATLYVYLAPHVPSRPRPDDLR